MKPLRWLLLGLSLIGCSGSAGERLARSRCASCHAFPEPELLDKKTWREGVLPQMAPRVGLASKSLFEDVARNPNMVVLPTRISQRDWERIVAYFVERAPDTLPPQSLPVQPQLDAASFAGGPFVPRLQSSAIVTLLKVDSANGGRVFVGEAGTNMLRVFDGARRLIATLRLNSPPTDVISDKQRVLILESGILEPNDQPRGTLTEYEFARDSLRFRKVLIDSLFRPVFVQELDVDNDGHSDFLICEYGDNRGRLALYRSDSVGYERRVLSPSAGAIRFALRDMTGDGSADVVALFGQGDERIVLFENDGSGNFGRQRTLARFPPVYGSMFFSLHDFNGDGHPDILYVNGDNFDYSRVLKPYHGMRILENDGKNNFQERYFYPIYGAAHAEVADFDGDGDLDVITTSNFAAAGHPERGIMYFENTDGRGAGGYRFQPYAFTIAATNQWNVMTTADLNSDGRPDVIIGAMDLASIARIQRRLPNRGSSAADPIVVLENRTPRR